MEASFVFHCKVVYLLCSLNGTIFNCAVTLTAAPVKTCGIPYLDILYSMMVRIVALILMLPRPIQVYRSTEGGAQGKLALWKPEL